MSGHSGRKQKREFKRRLQRIFGRDILDPKILRKVDFCDRNSRKLLVGSQHVNRWQNCLAGVSSYECIDLYRFLVAVKCSKEAVNHLRELVQDTPNYVQMVCFHLVALARTIVDIADVEEVLDTVARQNAYAYQTLLNSLTLAQQRALRLAANEKQSLFQKELLVKYEISSAPALHNSIKALKLKGILDEEGTAKGRVLFDDPLFAYWLRISFPM